MVYIKTFNNIMWMASGVGVGLLYSNYKKDIKKAIKKSPIKVNMSN